MARLGHIFIRLGMRLIGNPIPKGASFRVGVQADPRARTVSGEMLDSLSPGARKELLAALRREGED